MNIATTLHLKTMHGGACEFEKVIWTILKNSKKTADNDDEEEEERIKSEDHTRWHDDILTPFSWRITFSPLWQSMKTSSSVNWWTRKIRHNLCDYSIRISQRDLKFFLLAMTTLYTISSKEMKSNYVSTSLIKDSGNIRLALLSIHNEIGKTSKVWVNEYATSKFGRKSAVLI